MTVKSAPYYWLECDAPGCEAKSTSKDDEISAYGTVAGAEEIAEYSDWRIAGRYVLDAPNRHYCDEHAGNVCTDCDKFDATPYAGERDYLCVACAKLQNIIVCPSCGMPGETHLLECEAIRS